jgi:hypothetical protein
VPPSHCSPGSTAALPQVDTATTVTEHSACWLAWSVAVNVIW